MCREASGEIIDLPKSKEEELREAQLREEALKGMRERERRTALRKLEREAALAKDAARGATGEAGEGGDNDDDDEDDEDYSDTGEETADGEGVPADARGGEGGGGLAEAAPSTKDDLDWEAMSSDDEG